MFDKKTEKVEVEGEVLYVKQLGAKALRSCDKYRDDETLFVAALIAAAVVDEQGEAIWATADEASDIYVHAFTALGRHVLRVNELGQDDTEKKS